MLILLAGMAWIHGSHLEQQLAIVCNDGLIQDILPISELPDSCDGERVPVDILIPGLINAHCHLEYSHLAGLLPGSPVAFSEWLGAILESKADLASASSDAMHSSAETLLAGGCTTVLDCSTDGASARVLQQHGLRHYLFHEVLGLTVERANATLEKATVPHPVGSLCLGHGINPHAPYSVGPGLRESLRQLFRDQPDTICAWHLAESEDEMQLFSDATGGLADFLRTRNLPLPFSAGQLGRLFNHPSAFLKHEGLHGNCHYAFHLNFPHPIDLQHFCLPAAVVHCPGTHTWFNRSPFPMMELIDAGVNVCIGTDSLASSASLSMLDMVRSVAQKWPLLTDQQLVDLVTRNPARSHALRNHAAPLGILARGATADLLALDSGGRLAGTIREATLQFASAARVIVNGQMRYTKHV